MLLRASGVTFTAMALHKARAQSISDPSLIAVLL
jgi:hypothetical protein